MQRAKYTFKDIMVILGVVAILGGGVFSFVYLMLDSGYGACLIVRCVKILP